MSDFVTIVSGLPRSGTSMMMGMLGAGGMDLLVDDHRPGDESNPKGYFEFEPVAASRESVEWVPLAAGKAVKVIYALLETLPDGFDYRVVYLIRDIDEVVESQARMLARTGRSGAAVPREKLVEIFREERERSLAWLEERGNFRLLPVEYGDVLQQPSLVCRSIAAFLERGLDEVAMAAAVEPGLRNVRA